MTVAKAPTTPQIKCCKQQPDQRLLAGLTSSRIQHNFQLAAEVLCYSSPVTLLSAYNTRFTQCCLQSTLSCNLASHRRLKKGRELSRQSRRYRGGGTSVGDVKYSLKDLPGRRQQIQRAILMLILGMFYVSTQIANINAIWHSLSSNSVTVNDKIVDKYTQPRPHKRYCTLKHALLLVARFLLARLCDHFCFLARLLNSRELTSKNRHYFTWYTR